MTGEGWVHPHLTILALIPGINDSASWYIQAHLPMPARVCVVDRIVLDIAIEVLAEWVC